ncbi:hypothetical protein GGR56DRAFT_506341 [Xylariaceae sp. FL0804]|nr:hypothetical protein GGR56DRAFT_506341 [Xylariaceae sp. FL0804]
MGSSLVYLPVKDYVLAEIIVNSFVVFLVIAVVGLRVTARLMGPGVGWDDAFVMASVPLGIGMLACQGLFAPIGNGYDLVEYPQLTSNLVYILQVTFGMQIVYVTLLAAVKVSMLCFYLRVFVTKGVQLASKISLGVVVLWWIAYLCSCIFLCNPIEGQWTGVGQCGSYIPMIQSLIATNAMGDLIIMTLPMHRIWSLKTRRTDKIGITACFALGLACVVCAIFRLIYISTVDLNSNVTGTMPTTIFLFILEPNLAILCISIPMLRPFYVMYRKRTGGSRLNEYSNERSRSGYGRNTAMGTASKARAGHRSPGQQQNNGWEMDDYYERDGGNKHDAMVTAYQEDSDSEKALTALAAPRPRDVIGVQTTWKVTRE